MSSPLTADGLLRRVFLPLYPEDAARDLARARREDANPAGNPNVLAHLGDAAARFVANATTLFGEDLGLDGSDASVHRLSAALTRARRDAWLAQGGPPGSPDNALFNVVVHGAAYVGDCIVRHHGGTWSVRRPLWESFVRLVSPAGDAELAVFHWWLKALADDALEGAALGGSLADRYRAHVEVPRTDLAALPPIVRAPANEAGVDLDVPAERRLPRLAKVRYDLLYKHLKAHLPELKDLGADFPSPERFDELGFKWLDFRLLEGAKVLLIAGLGRAGVHLFWLDAGGFRTSAFVPCDAFPEPIVRPRKDGASVIEIHLAQDGATKVLEMLAWGP